jgi:glycosyltransferase involved in cell wall biosynthesis
MNPETFRLLFHHHDTIYHPGPGEIWMTAGIGRWISGLSAHFQEIGLLMHESSQRLPHQDYQVAEPNVKFVNLGPPGHYVDFFSKRRRIYRACKMVEGQTDGLLIRGMTPGQYSVWRHIKVPHKAFILVRRPRQKRLVRVNPRMLLSATINKWRELNFRRIVRNDTVVIANSPLHVEELNKIYKIKAHFVPTNTIRNAEFSPYQVRPLNNPVRLFFCGRLHVLKGVGELLNSVAILRQQGINCILDIAGALTEPEYSEYQQLVDKLNINKYVNWHGRIPFGEGLLDLYRSSDIFVLPTYTEGFPRVIWEAAVSCCPIITTAVGGIPALLTNEQHALLVRSKDSEALVSAVKRLIDDFKLRQYLIQQAYQLAQGFSVESCAEKMASILANEWN